MQELKIIVQEFLVDHPLIELGMVTAILVLAGALAKALKQPVLVGYIVAGLIMSPSALAVINNEEQIELFAHFGVSLLLFMVGLGLSPRIIKEVGKVALVAGLGQVIFTSLIGFGITLAMGFAVETALYIAIALTFSSTIVIVKLIGDRGDMATTYGKIALGMLIVQDIVAMLILMVISATMMQSQDVSNNTGLLIGRIVGSVILLGLFVGLMMRYVLPSILKYLSHHQEMLLLFVITWALLLGGLWYIAGFSMEIGALLAGVSLATSRYRFHISSELRPLRDFFVALFFVYLGSQIVFAGIAEHIGIMVILSLFVLIGNPLIVMTLMGRLGYTLKNSFMTGLTVAQTSEFSFIVVALAIKAERITDPMVLPIVTVIGLITMAGSSYFFAYADRLYRVLSPYLQVFAPRKGRETGELYEESHDVIILGYNRIGTYLVNQWRELGHSVLVMDFNPKVVDRAQKKGLDAIYGDVNDADLLAEHIKPKTQWVCSTIDDLHTNLNVLRIAKGQSEEVHFMGLGAHINHAEALYEQGADYVVTPHVSGAHSAWSVLAKSMEEPYAIVEIRKKHRDLLNDFRKLHK